MSIVKEIPKIDLDEKIKTLAELSPLEYDQIRKETAKQLDVQLKTLDSEVEKARDGNAGDGDGDGDGEKLSQADYAVILVKDSGAVLFHDDQDMAFAEIPVDDHVEIWAIESKQFKKWLNRNYWNAMGKTLREQARRDAISTLAGLAEIEGDEHPVHLRTAYSSGRYYIDLCDEQWRVIEVDKSGWRVLDRSPVKFRRTSTMEALPKPEKGGDFEKFWELVNVGESDRPFVLVWMLDSMRSNTQYPVLEIVGGHGTAKSTLHRFIRRLIDPNAIDLRGAPKSGEDIWVAARNNHCVSFENLSSLKANMQNVLCTVATDGGHAGRQFHTNYDEIVVKAFNPTILNGINPVITASDLSDRAIRIHLPKISGKAMREESEIRTAFEKSQQSIFSGLLDIFVKALKEVDNIELKIKPRMVSYSILGEAVGKVLKWKGSFNDNYLGMRSSLLIEATQGSPVIMAIVEMINDQGTFYGTYKTLLEKLDQGRYQIRGEMGTPTTRGLSGLITRHEQGLSALGFKVTRDAHGRTGSKIKIEIAQAVKSDEQGDSLLSNNVHDINSGRKVSGDEQRDDADDELRSYFHKDKEKVDHGFSDFKF